MPAGSFPEALRRQAVGTISGKIGGVPIQSGTLTETTWFVRDVGIVRQDRKLDYTVEAQEGAAVRVEETTERVLREFSLSKSD